MSLGTAGYSFLQSFTGNPLMDSMMVVFAEYLVLLIPLTLVYLWFQDFRGRSDAVLGSTSVLVGVASTYVLGIFYFHQPPQYQGFETILTKSMENAFPSQHTAAMFSFVWPMMYRDRRRIAAVLLLAAVLTGIGRVYTGLHFPIDILGGILASSMGFGLVYLFRDRIDYLSVRLESLMRESVIVGFLTR